ncbi:hypothetical protein [Rhodococcus sp. NPDC058521]|uniref:hypothetical protein n=1 Tax=Rhodococcus sp. NPDC058521 TaxID=3346536 RepID=UPI003668517E
MFDVTPDELRRGAAAARRFGDEHLAAIYEADADRLEQQEAPAVNPVAATTGDEGRTNPITEEGASSVSTVTDTLADHIGPDWDDLAVFEREILTEAYAGGISLELLRYLTTNTVVNRRAEVGA